MKDGYWAARIGTGDDGTELRAPDRPFIDAKVQAMKEMSLWQIVMIFLLALLLKAGFSSVDTKAVDVYLALVVFSALIVDIVQALWWCCSHRLVLHLASDLKRQSSAVSGQDEDNRVVNALAESSCAEDERGIDMAPISSSTADL